MTDAEQEILDEIRKLDGPIAKAEEQRKHWQDFADAAAMNADVRRRAQERLTKKLDKMRRGQHG